MTKLSELIHYDMIMGSHPEWRAALDEANTGKSGKLKRFILEIRPTMPVAANFLIASARYQKEGQQVFCVGSRFRNLLHETECDNVPKASLKLPYPCLYVAFPNCDLRLWGGSRTEMHQIAGAYLIAMGDDDDTGLGILVWGKANERSRAIDDDASFNVTIRFMDLPTVKDDPTCLDVETYLTRILGDPTREKSDIGLSIAEAPREEAAEHEQSIHSIIRVLLNLILYLNSTNAETERENSNAAGLRKALERTKSPKKRRKIERDLQQAATRVTWVGRSFERSETESRTGSGGGTWAYRRGHFHRFWIGPRKDADGTPQKGTDQKIQWVAPVRRDQAAVVASQTRVHRIRGDD